MPRIIKKNCSAGGAEHSQHAFLRSRKLQAMRLTSEITKAQNTVGSSPRAHARGPWTALVVIMVTVRLSVAVRCVRCYMLTSALVLLLLRASKSKRYLGRSDSDRSRLVLRFGTGPRRAARRPRVRPWPRKRPFPRREKGRPSAGQAGPSAGPGRGQAGPSGPISRPSGLPATRAYPPEPTRNALPPAPE